MYKGDFSNWVDQNNKLITIYDPARRGRIPAAPASFATPFPGNQIPANRFSTTASAIAAFGQPSCRISDSRPAPAAMSGKNYIVTGGNHDHADG